MSELNPEQIAIAVSTGDAKTLTRANGVGNKLAQRIILELKDKLKNITVGIDTSTTISTGTIQPISTGNISQALNALAVLGYSPDEVMPFMTNIDTSSSVEQIIKDTLKAIGKK